MIKRTIFAVVMVIASPAMAADSLSGYTPIPNVAPGVSYVRLYGASGSDTIFEVRAFGSTGQELTSAGARIVVPAGAMPQFSYSQIAQLAASQGARIVNLGPQDSTITLYVKPTDRTITGFYQHVQYNSANGFFENMGVCTFSNYTNISTINRRALDVHTSLLASYPSYIGVVNANSSDVKANVLIFDAENGGPLGLAPITVPALSTYKVPYTDLESLAALHPSGNQSHVNLEIQWGGDAPSPLIMFHTVRQQQSGIETNMTPICPILSPPDPTPLYRVGTGNSCDLASNAYFTSGGIPAGPVIGETVQLAQTVNCPVVDLPANRSTKGLIPTIETDGSVRMGGAGADGTIAAAGDSDWYRAYLVPGREYSIYVSGLNNEFPPSVNLKSLKIRLLDSNGYAVPSGGYADNSACKGPLCLDAGFKYVAPTATDTVPQLYFVEVSAYDGTSTGPYQVAVVPLPN